MRKFLLLAAVFLFAGIVHAEPFETAPVHDCFVKLLRDSSWGLGGDSERAAFIVDRGDGILECVPWPASHRYLSESYHGAFPVRTVAIVHTHPVNRPFPSGHDKDEASRIGLPIYVVSLFGVKKADPDGQVVTVARGCNWTRIPKGLMAGTATISASATTSP